MIRLERFRVADVQERPGRYDLVVEREGAVESAVAYADAVARPQVGDVAICNTTAVRLGLGTGGVHIVVAIEGREAEIGTSGHAMKARYLSSQVAVDAADETGADLPETLDGTRVVVCPLHSLLAPATVAIRALRPEARIVYVMTDEAALPAAFGNLVPAMKDRGLLDATVTAGQAFGGDLEATTTHTALLAARHTAGADVIVAAMGPGHLGTGSRWGFAGIRVAETVRAVHALEGDATLCARISFADPRPRHQGVSHHTTTVASLAEPVRLVVPDVQGEQGRKIEEDLGPIPFERVATGGVVHALEEHSELLRSMGRGYEDDPVFFLAGAAAGIDALR